MSRIADVKEDELEELYEKRLKKKALKKEEGEKEAEVIRFDALPVKTLDGKLYYQKCNDVAFVVNGYGGLLSGVGCNVGLICVCVVYAVSETKRDSKDGEYDETDADSGGRDPSVVRLTKAERRAKLKKIKKEAKRLGKDLDKQEEVEQTPQAAVLVF